MHGRLLVVMFAPGIHVLDQYRSKNDVHMAFVTGELISGLVTIEEGDVILFHERDQRTI